MTFRPLLACLSLCLGITAQSPAQENKPAGGYAKVLFLGNSITKHGPKADIDWSGNWGMAASAENKDYVHIVTEGLRQRQSSPPNVLVQNIADFERAHAKYDVEAKFADASAFQANLIILAIGENVPGLATDEAKATFKGELLKVLKKLKGPQNPTIIVRSCFWNNTAKDQILEECAKEVGGIFANISTLGKDESNYARSERPYKHAGVANHPGDKGMQSIADSILAAIPKR